MSHNVNLSLLVAMVAIVTGTALSEPQQLLLYGLAISRISSQLTYLALSSILS